MKRHIALGFEAAATATCAGIVFGLYRCRGKNSDRPRLGRGLPRGDRRSRRGDAGVRDHREALSTWRLPSAIVDQVPEWADMIGRASERAAGKAGKAGKG